MAHLGQSGLVTAGVGVGVRTKTTPALGACLLVVAGSAALVLAGASHSAHGVRPAADSQVLRMDPKLGCPHHLDFTYKTARPFSDALLRPGVSTLAVCVYRGGYHQTRRTLDGTVAFPRSTLAGDLTALNSLPYDDSYPLCFDVRPEPVLGLVADYPDASPSIVPLVASCGLYFDNGSFQAAPTPALIKRLGLGSYQP